MTSHDNRHPKIAVIDNNTLAALGLKHILQQVMPIAVIDCYNSLEELENGGRVDDYYHFFAAVTVVLSSRASFERYRCKTIVLTGSMADNRGFSNFHSLCVDVPEKELVKSLLKLEQNAHGNGKNLPPMIKKTGQGKLSVRETEVISFIARGYSNKEIADKLNISITTAMTHRRNIMEKLGMRTVSAMTIYAVMNGYVDVSSI